MEYAESISLHYCNNTFSSFKHIKTMHRANTHLYGFCGLHYGSYVSPRETSEHAHHLLAPIIFNL